MTAVHKVNKTKEELEARIRELESSEEQPVPEKPRKKERSAWEQLFGPIPAGWYGYNEKERALASRGAFGD